MTYPMTRNGYENLEAELKDLKMNQRPRISKEIGVAREHGDLKENAEYHAAREKQSWIETRIQEIENMIANAQIIDVDKIESDSITFGANVILVNEDTDEEVTYKLVGVVESNLEKGLISNTSPLGRALLGKEQGDSIQFDAPSGTKYFEILQVSYGN